MPARDPIPIVETRIEKSLRLTQRGARAIERSRVQVERAHENLATSEGRLVDTQLRRPREDD